MFLVFSVYHCSNIFPGVLKWQCWSDCRPDGSFDPGLAQAAILRGQPGTTGGGRGGCVLALHGGERGRGLTQPIPMGGREHGLVLAGCVRLGVWEFGQRNGGCVNGHHSLLPNVLACLKHCFWGPHLACVLDIEHLWYTLFLPVQVLLITGTSLETFNAK